MKKNSFLPASALLILLLILLSACKKIELIELKKICRIEKMNTITGDVILPRYFSYDKWDNPIEVKFDDPGTGTATFNFWYDNHHRLAGYNGYSSHQYTYDNSGLAIIDTINANYVGLDLWFEEKLYYDQQRRIIKSINKMYKSRDPNQSGLNQVITTYYNYDGNGNLIRPGVVYDKNVNLLRTNPVWRLIHKDYSLNNPLPGPTHYNTFGLPEDPRVIFMDHFVAEVFYDCTKIGLPARK